MNATVFNPPASSTSWETVRSPFNSYRPGAFTLPAIAATGPTGGMKMTSSGRRRWIRGFVPPPQEIVHVEVRDRLSPPADLDVPHRSRLGRSPGLDQDGAQRREGGNRVGPRLPRAAHDVNGHRPQRPEGDVHLESGVVPGKLLLQHLLGLLEGQAPQRDDADFRQPHRAVPLDRRFHAPSIFPQTLTFTSSPGPST